MGAQLLRNSYTALYAFTVFENCMDYDFSPLLFGAGAPGWFDRCTALVWCNKIT